MNDILNKLLSLKNSRLDDLFNLERKPEYPKDYLKIVYDKLSKIGFSTRNANELYRYEQEGVLTELDKIKDDALKIIHYTKSLESTIDDYKYAYEALSDLLHQIVNKDEIDIRKYTNNITDDEWKKVNRSKRIDNIIK